MSTTFYIKGGRKQNDHVISLGSPLQSPLVFPQSGTRGGGTQLRGGGRTFWDFEHEKCGISYTKIAFRMQNTVFSPAALFENIQIHCDVKNIIFFRLRRFFNIISQLCSDGTWNTKITEKAPQTIFLEGAKYLGFPPCFPPIWNKGGNLAIWHDKS